MVWKRQRTIKVTFLKKSTVRQREKPFVLVLMLKILFQKAGEKSLIDRRNAHHVTFKQNITGATLTKMLY